MLEFLMFNEKRYNKISKINNISDYCFLFFCFTFLVLNIVCPIPVVLNIVFIIEFIFFIVFILTSNWLVYYKDEIDSLKEK